MGAQRQLWIALALSLCAAVLLRGAGAQSPTLTVDRNGNTNTITLECVDSFNNPVMDNTVEYRYRSPTTTPPGSDPVPVTLKGDDRRSVEFVLTPQTEGEYFCTVNDAPSATEELVAFPEQIPMVNALAIQRGDTLTLDCDFEVGLLDSHYVFTWFRINSISELREPLLNGADRVRVFTSDQINSLEIMAVKIEDESDRYYCRVTITHPSLGPNPVPADGRDIRVDVFDEVHVRMGLSMPKAVHEGDEAQFQCEFDGDPAPSIKWKLNGDEVQNGSDSGRFLVSTISREADSITRATSTFTITSTKAQDNGLVECEATNTNSEDTPFTAASNTSLTVLSTNVTLFLTTTTPALQNDSVVYLHFTLPAEFIVPVTVTAQYDDATDGSAGSFERVYSDMFSNTMDVDFRIPELPPFNNFTTRITFSSAGVTTVPILAQPQAIRIGGLQSGSQNDDDFVRDNNFIVVVVVSVSGLVIIITVLMIVAAVVYCKVSHHKESKPSSRGGRTDDSGLLDYTVEVISLPWQALFSVKDDPWQASWHLSAKKITRTDIDESESRTVAVTTELEEITFDAYLAVDVPWQAMQQEPEALDLPVWESRDRLMLLYHYHYYQIVETVTTTQRDSVKDKCQTQQPENASTSNSQEDHPQQGRQCIQSNEEVKIELEMEIIKRGSC